MKLVVDILGYEDVSVLIDKLTFEGDFDKIMREELMKEIREYLKNGEIHGKLYAVKDGMNKAYVNVSIEEYYGAIRINYCFDEFKKMKEFLNADEYHLELYV